MYPKFQLEIWTLTAPIFNESFQLFSHSNFKVNNLANQSKYCGTNARKLFVTQSLSFWTNSSLTLFKIWFINEIKYSHSASVPKGLGSNPAQDLVSQWNYFDQINWFYRRRTLQMFILLSCIRRVLATQGEPRMSAMCASVAFRNSLKKKEIQFPIPQREKSAKKTALIIMPMKKNYNRCT